MWLEYIRFSFGDTAQIALPIDKHLSVFHSSRFLLQRRDVICYTAPLAIQNIDFLLPAEEGVILNCQNINGPEVTTLQKSKVLNSKLAIELGSGLVSLVMIGVGVWQWRRTRDDDSEVEAGNPSVKSRLDIIIAEIAQLDEARDRGEIDAPEHQQRRAILRNRAKAILDEKEDGS